MKRLALLTALVGWAHAQNICQTGEEPPPDYYGVEGLVYTRFAQTIITMQIFNGDCREALEREVPIVIPGNAYITDFRTEDDLGQVFQGKVTEAQQWQEILNRQRELGNQAAAVSATRLSDPLREPSRDTNEYAVNMVINPGAKLTIFVTYQEILYRREGFSKYFVHVPSQDDFPDFEMGMVVSDKRKFLEVIAPEPETGLNSKEMFDLIDLADTAPLDGTGALYLEGGEDGGGADNEPNDYRLVTYTDGDRFEEQDIVVLYSLDYEDDGSGIDSEVIQTSDGFFAHFITPTREDLGDRDIVFVLDKSGSMRGPKFAQLKRAMLEIIKDLEEKNRDGGRDRFNIMLFSTTTQWLLGEGLKDASDPRVINDARQAIEAAEAKGWTNSGEALEQAINVLRDEKIGSGTSNRLTQTVYFLTDGLPVVPRGNPVKAQVIDRDEIRDQVFEANQNGDGEAEIQIHTMAFGNDADEVALKELAQDNLGLYRKIYSDSDANLQLKGAFREFSAIATRDTEVEYIGANVVPESLVVNDAAQGAQFDVGSGLQAGRSKFSNAVMNDGSQMVIVGQVRPAGRRVKRQTRGSTSAAWRAYFACNLKCPRGRGRNACRRSCNRLKPRRSSSRRSRKPQQDFEFAVSAKTSGRSGQGIQSVSSKGSSRPKDDACRRLSVQDLQKKNKKGSLTKKLKNGNNRVELLQKRGFVCDERRWSPSARLYYAQLSRRSKRQAEEKGRAIDVDKIVAPSSTVQGYVQRFWAHQTVNRLIEDAITEEYQDEAKARTMNQRALQLSLKYKFVNELTSLVVAETPVYALRESEEGAAPFLTEASLTDLPPQASCALHVAVVVDLSSGAAQRSPGKFVSAAGDAMEALADSSTVSLLVLAQDGSLRTALSGRSKAEALSAVAGLRAEAEAGRLGRLSRALPQGANRLVLVHYVTSDARALASVQRALGLDRARSVGVQRTRRRRDLPVNVGNLFAQVFSNTNLKGISQPLNKAC